MNVLLTLLLLAVAPVWGSDLWSWLYPHRGIDYSTDGLYRLRGNLRPPSVPVEAAEAGPRRHADLQLQKKILREAKYHLINGDLDLARLLLVRNTYAQTPLRPIIYRYLGLLNFIDGRFEDSYKNLAVPELNRYPHYPKICLLQTLNRIALGRLGKLEEEWNRCKLESGTHLQQTREVWVDTLVKLRTAPAPGITRAPFVGVRLAGMETEDVKIFLKLALYLNQERLVRDQLQDLTVLQLNDPEIREIAGQILFRSGSWAASYRFIEDLRSPNVENIKGNLYVLRKKYEVAYAQFRLALEQKANSQNALERLLPLAWILRDWENGATYAERVMASPQTQIHKLTLYAAFLSQQGKFERSAEVLENVSRRSDKGGELEVTQLKSFAGLMTNRQRMMKENAELSCRQMDLVNCWLLFQIRQWGSFPVTVRREDGPQVKPQWERLVQEGIEDPLKEIVYVNQIDIEELDDQLILLIDPAP